MQRFEKSVWFEKCTVQKSAVFFVLVQGFVLLPPKEGRFFFLKCGFFLKNAGFLKNAVFAKKKKKTCKFLLRKSAG